MPAATNPFPGMNPYLEAFWHDVHPALLIYARNQMQRALPDDLSARVEQHLTLHEESGEGFGRRADVAIVESWSGGASKSEPLLAASGVAVAEPVLIELDPARQRFLKIVDSENRIVTVVEFLSPSNKLRLDSRMDFRWKRHQALDAGISFVEVDLLLQGEMALDEEGCEVLRRKEAAYHVAVHIPDVEEYWKLYPIALRERLPAIAIPLRPSDPPVALDLQPLVDDANRDGGYARINYRKEPPGKLSDEDRAWLDAHLRQQGLR